MRRATIAILAVAAVLAVAIPAAFLVLPDAAAATIPPSIAVANNDFAVDFYRAISDTDGNIFFSPTSIFVAFSMVYEGAAGDTAVQLAEGFGFEPDNAVRHELIRASLDSLNRNDRHATLEIASAVWLADSLSPHSSYSDTIRNIYRSLIDRADFGDPNAAAMMINGWVSEKTGGLIPMLFPSNAFDEYTAMVLANAIYFKGTWKEQFPVESTRPGNFWTDNSTSVTADMMSVKGMFSYYGNADIQMIELPYEGDRFSMLVVLPKERDGIGNLEQNISAEKLEQWAANATDQEIFVRMPKFKLDVTQDLKEPLRALGIDDIFGTKSDLSNIAAAHLYASKAIHKAVVNVNEEGTEAAAVTGIELAFTSLPPSFIANHPFLFFIQDNESGTVLFMGRVSDPTA